MTADKFLLKTYFGWTSVMNPEKAARQSFRLFQKVRKKDIREREEHFFSLARAFEIPGAFEPVHCFELGDPHGELVLLVHGWDSNAGSLSMIAHALAKKNKRVISFNLPGHAFSNSSYTNLLECSQAFRAVLEYLNPKDPFSVVAHSFGSAVSTYTLARSSYKVDKLVLLTNPNKLENIFKEFKNFIGLGDRAYARLVKMTHDRLGEPLHAVSVEENLKRLSYQRLLLIHDVHDKVLPFRHSEEVNSAIENARLVPMEHIGHYKMLWNKEVIERTAAFVDGREVY